MRRVAGENERGDRPMDSNQAVKPTKPKARHRRGASYVETALVVSVAAGVGALAIGAAGHASSDTAQREATCIRAGFEGCTAGTAEVAGVAPSDMARTAEPTPHERSH